MHTQQQSKMDLVAVTAVNEKARITKSPNNQMPNGDWRACAALRFHIKQMDFETTCLNWEQKKRNISRINPNMQIHGIFERGLHNLNMAKMWANLGLKLM